MKLTINKTKNSVGAFIYKISPAEIIIGNQDTHNTADIEFELPDEWQGLTVRATFTPNSKKPIEMLIFDNAIELKSDITAENGVLVVDAFNDNVHFYTTDCQYKVARHGEVGGSEPEYTPTQIEQVLSQVQGYVNEANTAKEQALGAAQYVENVKLNAEQSIQQQTANSIKSIEDKSTEQQQAISEFLENKAQQIVSDSKVEIENKTNLSKTEIDNFTSLKKQEIENTANEKIAEIQAEFDDLERKYYIKTVMDSVATPHTQYFLGEQTSVDVVLPDAANMGDIITVCWYNGATAASLIITGTMLEFSYAPSANSRSEINALWDGMNWAILGNEMAVPSEVTE